MTAGPHIPDEIRRFILTSIPSVPYLEALLLLRNEADVAWEAKGLARRLYLSDKAALALLTELHASGVLHLVDQEPPRYRYSPNDESLREMIDQLADAYARQLVEVTNLIHSKTSKKAQHFADAFKWRKED